MQRSVAVCVGRARAVRRERAYKLNQPVSIGVIQCGVPRIVRRRGVRAQFYQILGGFGFFRLNRVHERRFAVLVRRVYIRVAVREQFDNFFIARHGGAVKRRHRRVGQRIDVCALVQKKFNYVFKPLSARVVQRRKPRAVYRVNIYSVLFEKSYDNAFLTVLACFKQKLFHLYLRRVRQTLYRNII